LFLVGLSAFVHNGGGTGWPSWATYHPEIWEKLNIPGIFAEILGKAQYPLEI
jgi:hypothetical protein